MRRKTDAEMVKPFRLRESERSAQPIRARLEAWKASGVIHLLEESRPAAIDGLGDRQNDISEPLLAIAGVAGADWLHTLTSALVAVLKGKQSENVSKGETLLADIRSIFTERNADKIFSKDLAGALCEIEGRPWADWNRGSGLKKNDLARQLAKYHIHPQKISIETDKLQGYRIEAFDDAWKRYCPIPPTSAGTSELSASLLEKSGTGMVPGSRFGDSTRNCSNPHEQRAFGGLVCLHLAFCEWEQARGGVPCTRETFAALLAELGFLMGEIDRTVLVSGLVLREDMEAQ